MLTLSDKPVSLVGYWYHVRYVKLSLLFYDSGWPSYQLMVSTGCSIQFQSFCCLSLGTGTGKTLSFALPIIERLSAEGMVRTERNRPPIVLVMAPTRELASQVRVPFSPFLSFPCGQVICPLLPLPFLSLWSGDVSPPPPSFPFPVVMWCVAVHIYTVTHNT